MSFLNKLVNKVTTKKEKDTGTNQNTNNNENTNQQQNPNTTATTTTTTQPTQPTQTTTTTTTTTTTDTTTETKVDNENENENENVNKQDNKETKETKETETETKIDDEDSDLGIGKWRCDCGLINDCKEWKCIGCFTRISKKTVINVPQKMKSLVKEKEGEGYTLKENDVPEPEEGELLIKSFIVGICGSDIQLYKWTKSAQTFAKVPFTPGHEAVGLVVKCGKNTRMRVGTRVAIENHFYCGKCKLCEEKRGDICLNLNQFGHGKGTIYGGCSEYFIVPEIYCYRLRSNITWDQAALLEPIGVAHNACQRLKCNGVDYTLVIGCGPVGLFAVSCAKALGSKNVIACDILDNKLKLATAMGADIIINSKEKDLKEEIMKITENIGVQRIVECSGNSRMVNNSFSLLRKGGAIVLVGLPKEPLHVENVMHDILFKSIRIETIHGRRIFDTWKQTERLVSTGKILADKVVSHKIPLSQWKKGYEALMSGQACKVLIDPTK